MKERDKSKSEKFSVSKRATSFAHAGRGIWIFLKNTHNAWLHIAFLALAILCGFMFEITSIEWIALVLASGLVLVSEAFNTAIEIDINLTSPEYHPYARDTKDVAAGAVLIATLTAIIIGLFIFVPHITRVFPSNAENELNELTYVEPSGAFTFKHRGLFLISDGSPNPTLDWRSDSATLGNILTTVIIPKSYLPGTNFSDARLIFGRSSDVNAIKNCTKENSVGSGTGVMSEKATLSGFPVMKFLKNGAALGNYYEAIS